MCESIIVTFWLLQGSIVLFSCFISNFYFHITTVKVSAISDCFGPLMLLGFISEGQYRDDCKHVGNCTTTCASIFIWIPKLSTPALFSFDLWFVQTTSELKLWLNRWLVDRLARFSDASTLIYSLDGRFVSFTPMSAAMSEIPGPP